MKKEFNRNEIAAIKRAAANVKPMANKRARIIEKINALFAEKEAIEEQIKYLNAPIEYITGYTAEDIITYDETGKPILKYPETIIPNIIDEETKEVEVDDTEKVDEIQSTPAQAPFNPIN
jgi:hypothetical protein